VRQWVPAPYRVLGTDGFGRSDTREKLRWHFEVDRNFVAFAALRELAAKQVIPEAEVTAAMATLGIDPGKADPLLA
jgi:pyruvate dehydrogenase E1 component